MKKAKRFMTFVLAMIMVLAMGMSAMAATESKTELVTDDNAGTASITVTLPTVEEGATANNTYKIYKVFDATNDGNTSAISYKLVAGKKEAPEGFKVDDAGNVLLERTTGELTQLTDEEITAIAEYVEDTMLAATVTTTADDKSFSVEDLPYGYYYITTTTGTVVTVDSTNPTATVNDKNTAPTLDKKISGASSYDEDGKKALAQVGTDVTYTATITVGNGMKNYVFHDAMSNGLTLKKDSITVTGATGYTVKETPDAGDTLTITFVDGLEAGTVITITYSATINENALTDDPENNTAYVSFGDENSNNKTPSSTTQTWNAQIAVVKYDGNNTEETKDDTALSGAGFKLKNTDGKYYHLNITGENRVVEWKDDIADGDEHTSGADGKIPAFTGLADGNYTLVETTVPAGYNKAEDTAITIEQGDYTAANLEQSKDVLNNKGAVLPSTGGIGTTMFYVVGGALVLIAVVLLVTRRRMDAQER